METIFQLVLVLVVVYSVVATKSRSGARAQMSAREEALLKQREELRNFLQPQVNNLMVHVQQLPYTRQLDAQTLRDVEQMGAVLERLHQEINENDPRKVDMQSTQTKFTELYNKLNGLGLLPTNSAGSSSGGGQ